MRCTPVAAALPVPSGSPLGTLQVTARHEGVAAGLVPGSRLLLEPRAYTHSIAPVLEMLGTRSRPEGLGTASPCHRGASAGAVSLMKAGLGENHKGERDFGVDVGLPSSPGGGNVWDSIRTGSFELNGAREDVGDASAPALVATEPQPSSLMASYLGFPRSTSGIRQLPRSQRAGSFN